MSVWFIDNSIDERWAWHDIFSPEECEQIIKQFSDKTTTATTVGNIINGEVRKSDISWVNSKEQENSWIYRRCTDAITNINNTHFHYDLTFIENMQFTVYKSSDSAFYGKHIDCLYNSGVFRKLSFTILLNDPATYQGGELNFHYEHYPIPAPQKVGAMVAFPSHTLHEVLPVTEGTRYSLVGWVCGPRFK